MRASIFVAVLAWPMTLAAQVAEDVPPSAPANPPSAPTGEARPPIPDDTVRDEPTAEAAEPSQQLVAPEAPTETIAPPPPWETKLRWNGYVDVGFFGTTGDGAGHVQDVGHVLFPQYDGVGWVFHGDPLATAVNSRGEPADTGSTGGASRAIVFDSIDSGGKPTFLVNEVNLDLTVAPHRKVWVLASVDLVPRGRAISDTRGINLGDFMEVDLAFVNWTAHDENGHIIELQAGKVDSVMGVEYRIQESPDRFGIAPSLIFRYLGGHPVGIKLRSRHWEEKLNVAVSVTNGSHFVETFPFHDERDSNAFKTVAGRVGVHHEGEDATIEVGSSALFGAQDQQPTDTGVWQWQLAGDVVVSWRDFELRAEYTRGRARGDSMSAVPCDRAPCLRFQGAYGELAYRIANWVGFGFRVDWRDADHRAGNEFVYVSDLVRTTAMARFEIDRFAIIKAEYTHTHELFGRPRIDNDVVTSSAVVTW